MEQRGGLKKGKEGGNVFGAKWSREGGGRRRDREGNRGRYKIGKGGREGFGSKVGEGREGGKKEERGA